MGKIIAINNFFRVQRHIILYLLFFKGNLNLIYYPAPLWTFFQIPIPLVHKNKNNGLKSTLFRSRFFIVMAYWRIFKSIFFTRATCVIAKSTLYVIVMSYRIYIYYISTGVVNDFRHFISNLYYISQKLQINKYTTVRRIILTTYLNARLYCLSCYIDR